MKIKELEVKQEQLLKEKNREVEDAKNDLILCQDLVKDHSLTIKGKNQRIQELETQIEEFNSKLRAKTESDLTMNEVIERCKGELAYEYEPVIL